MPCASITSVFCVSTLCDAPPHTCGRSSPWQSIRLRTVGFAVLVWGRSPIRTCQPLRPIVFVRLFARNFLIVFWLATFVVLEFFVCIFGDLASSGDIRSAVLAYAARPASMGFTILLVFFVGIIVSSSFRSWISYVARTYWNHVPGWAWIGGLIFSAILLLIIGLGLC